MGSQHPERKLQRMEDIPSLNLGRILHGGGEVSNQGEVTQLELIEPAIHAGDEPRRTPIPLVEPARWRASVSHVGENEFYLSGRIKGVAMLECARCLEPTPTPFEAQLGYLLRYNPRIKHQHLEDTDDDEEVIVFGDATLDLSNILAESVSLELPISVLHAPDCRGLCAVCGTNLNHVPANTCAVGRAADCPNVQHEATDHPDNPFAKLKGLLKD